MEYSYREKTIWIDLLVTTFVSIYYFTHVYILNSWNELGGTDMGRVISNVIIISIIASIVLHFSFNNNKEEKKDERDLIIEAKGNAYGYYTLYTASVLIIGHIMFNEGVGYIFPDRIFQVTGPFIMHIILVALFFSSFAKSITQIFSYRRGY
ncbi:MAG: hypothetical protein HOM01_11035 [Kordiimonadaceae bacterium]|nr:hypothetical protein [Kordiimonadaceae bacterium]